VPTTNEIFLGDAAHPAGPYGLGVRVPMVIVSPWTRGGWVNSQLFDHTSLIRFLEARFAGHRADLVESNITPWRRAVVGDLTTAFDFRTPNVPRRPDLPDTDAPEDLVRHPDQVPVPPPSADQQVPRQERGVRPARAIPYTLHADGHASDAAFSIELGSAGNAAAVFQVRSAGSNEQPRSYTVEPGKHLSDSWHLGSGYDLSVHGPNGFFRGFKGRKPGMHQANLDITASYHERPTEIVLAIGNRGLQPATVTVRDGYTSRETTLSLGPGQTQTQRWSLSGTRSWYDLVITVAGDPHFEYRYAGHLENGEDSISDPAMGGLI